MVTKGFQNIQDFAFKKDKYNVKWTKNERAIIKVTFSFMDYSFNYLF